MSALDDWTAAACAEAGVEPSSVAIRTVLDLARDVAHQVERPAAPVTAFVVGVAVGSGRSVDEVAGLIRELALRWGERGASDES